MKLYGEFKGTGYFSDGQSRPELQSFGSVEYAGKFGSMPTHFFESSWGHYASKAG
jgi:hypothetical protein